MQTAATQARARALSLDRLDRNTAAKLGFGGAAGISFLLSVFLWFTGQQAEGLFVGIWVPSILSLGALVLSGRRNDS